MQVSSVSYDVAGARWSTRFPAGDSPRTLVTVFGSSQMTDHPEVFVELARAYPRSLIVGCSSAGEIQGTQVRDGSLAVTITRFDRTELALAWSEVPGAGDSERIGGELAQRLVAQGGLRAALILGDSPAVNGAGFARGVGRTLGDAVTVTGGLAADGSARGRTWLTVGGALKRGIAVAVGFYGPNVVVGHGVSADWLPQRAGWLITRGEGDRVYELDDQPAIEVYRAALADRGDELPEVAIWFPLAVGAAGDAPVVRTVVGLDHQAGALVLAGEVSAGQTAVLLTADLEDLIGGGVQAAVGATKTGAPRSIDCLALAISCFGRRKLLGSWSGEEIVAVRDGLHAERTTVTGFYGYGQIAAAPAGPAALHNQTLSLTVFSEARPAEAARVAERAVPPPVPVGYAVRTVLYDLRAGTWSAPLPELDSPRTLVLVFGAPELVDRRAPLDALRARYPASVILGCSTAGEIHDQAVHDRTVAVSIVRFARTELRLAVERIADPGDGAAVGERLARALVGQGSGAPVALRGMLVLADGLAINGSALARGLAGVVGGALPVGGALAGDGRRFARTWVLGAGELGERLAVAVGLYGAHVAVGHGVRGGWDRFGLKRTITRSTGNVLYELDGRPALDIYQEYLGDRARQLPGSGLSLPLAVRDPVSDLQVVRTIVAVDAAAGSLTFAGDVPAGHAAQFMKADVERLVNGATHAALMASETGPAAGADRLVVAISSAGRRNLLGGRVEEEIEAVAEAFRASRAQIIGMYAYGELTPGAGGACELHNQTMSLFVISETAVPAAASPPPPLAVATPPALPAMPTQLAPVAVPRPSAAAPPPVPAEAPPEVASARPGELVGAQPREAAGAPVAETAPPDAARGPIVRIPHLGIADLALEASAIDGELRVLRIRGKITESFKGEVAARELRGRVILDLGDIQRITSFGVREWLAMFAGASELAACYFARCSEAVVNQLTMIRAFDGGAQILSFFGPYLCGGCGKPFERLFDCELDHAEITRQAIESVRCPRCNAPGRFDDDPRSYFAFFGSARPPVPDDVRALHARLCTQDHVRPAEELEQVVEGDATRIRVMGRLSLGIRWRRVLEHVDGLLIIDLSAATGVDPSGVQSLDFHLRQLPATRGVIVEHAPVDLVQRLAQRPAPQIAVTSVVVEAFCPTCEVVRAAVLAIAPPRGGPVTCKRCDGPLHVKLEPIVEHYLATLEPAAPAPVPAPARSAGGARWAIWACVAVVGVAAPGVVYAWLRADRRPPAAPTATVIELLPVEPPAQAAAPDALPPSWADRPFTLDGDHVYLVGESDAAASDAAIAQARHQATARLIDQLVIDLASAPIHALFAEPTGARTGDRAVAAFDRAYGKLASFERIEVATVRRAGAPRRLLVRFGLASADYEKILADHRDAYEFRGMTVALAFPGVGETERGAGGSLVVAAVQPGSAAAAARLVPGDAVLRVGATAVATLDELRAALRSAWQQPEVRRRLTLELARDGAARRVFFGWPHPKGAP